MVGGIASVQGIVAGIGNRRNALSPIIDKVYPMVGRRRFPLPGIKRSLRPGGRRNGVIGIGPVRAVDGAAGIGLIGIEIPHKERRKPFRIVPALYIGIDGSVRGMLLPVERGMRYHDKIPVVGLVLEREAEAAAGVAGFPGRDGVVRLPHLRRIGQPEKMRLPVQREEALLPQEAVRTRAHTVIGIRVKEVAVVGKATGRQLARMSMSQERKDCSRRGSRSVQLFSSLLLSRLEKRRL